MKALNTNDSSRVHVLPFKRSLYFSFLHETSVKFVGKFYRDGLGLASRVHYENNPAETSPIYIGPIFPLFKKLTERFRRSLKMSLNLAFNCVVCTLEL